MAVTRGRVCSRLQAGGDGLVVFADDEDGFDAEGGDAGGPVFTGAVFWPGVEGSVAGAEDVLDGELEDLRGGWCVEAGLGEGFGAVAGGVGDAHGVALPVGHGFAAEG